MCGFHKGRGVFPYFVNFARASIISTMKILCIDLASHSSQPGEGACVACVSGEKTEAICFIDHRIGDNGIMPVINDVMKEAGWNNKDLTNIACVTGPGGFTSLRMAVTLANVYGDQLNIPLAGVHLCDLYEARNPKSEIRNVVWLHSTRKTQMFARGFGEYASIWEEPTLVSLEDLEQKLPNEVVITGELIPEHREALVSKNVTYAPVLPIAEALPGFLSTLDYHSSPLVPWYGRGW